MRVLRVVIICCLGFPLLFVLLLTYIVIFDQTWIHYSELGLGLATIAAIGGDNDASLSSNEAQLLTDDSITEQMDHKSIGEKDPTIPEALQPVTYKYCCEMGSGNLKPTGDKCRDTCYTGDACRNTQYPFSSRDEKAFFFQDRKKWKRKKWRRPKINECVKKMSQIPSQPSKWCQEPQQEQSQEGMNVTNIPMGCSMVMGMGGMSGPFDRTFLFPKGKLAFCGIPKVGISSWLQFLRFTIGAKDYQSIPHQKEDLQRLRFDRLRPVNQKKIIESDDWTWSVFLRDPAERFLSAYLDKVENRNLSWLRQMPNMTFTNFVYFVAEQNVTCQEDRGASTQPGLTWCMDPHWRPQTWSCGLWEILPHFDFVGSIDSAAQASRELLEKVNLWDSYGKHYITSKSHEVGDKICRMPPPQTTNIKEEHKGFQQYHRPITNTSAKLYGHSHKKNTSTRMKEYYTKELLDKVKELYADDYKLWNALSKYKSGWSRGREIAATLNPSCAKD